jgi:hypothetical protein
MLTESYKNRLKKLSGISESKIRFEYQVRNIDGDVYYKREKGTKVWKFTSELDFHKNSNRNNIVKWKNKEEKKKNNKKTKSNTLEQYKEYFENICPSKFKIEIEGENIVIKNIK